MESYGLDVVRGGFANDQMVVAMAIVGATNMFGLLGPERFLCGKKICAIAT